MLAAKIKKIIKGFFRKLGFSLFRVNQGYYVTYWSRPQKARDVIYPPSNATDTAIIIQGPLKYEDNFTLETVRLYRKLFPTCAVIVTTWSNEDADTINQIKNEGAQVCLCDFPEELKGIDKSVNLQRKNTKKGVEQAGALGYKYVAKTRSDQRIYSPNAMAFCKSMLEFFPLEKTDTPAKARLISTSLGTFKNRYYNVSDLFIFGFTEDLLRYYSCPEDERPSALEPEAEDVLEWSKRRTGEIWFTTYYLEAVGHKLEWTHADNDCTMRDWFIIIDVESLDLYWPKYTDSEYRWRSYNDGVLKQVTFSDWFLMYANKATFDSFSVRDSQKV